MFTINPMGSITSPKNSLTETLSKVYKALIEKGDNAKAKEILLYAKQKGINLGVEDTTSGLMSKRYEELSNINSPFYQSFEKSLRSKLTNYISASTPTTSNLLAVGLASGLGYGSASSIASKQREAIEAKNRETIARTVESGLSQVFMQGQQMAGSALGMLGNYEQNAEQMAMQYAQLRQQQEESSFGNQLLGGLLGIGSSLLGNWAGGALGISKAIGGGTSSSGFSGGFQMPKVGSGTLQGWLK